MSSEDESGILMENMNTLIDDEVIYMECELDARYRKRKSKETRKELVLRKLRTTCACSGDRVKIFLCSVFPILSWLPRYDVKKDLMGDVTAGLTVGIVQIPQGMAYALLATLPPIFGMYVSFFPVLLYAIFGTSKHLSIGTFAVVSILISEVLAQRIPQLSNCGEQSVGTSTLVMEALADASTSTVASLNSTVQMTTGVDCNSIIEKRKLELAVALSMCVGIIQVAMHIFQLGQVTVFLSESLLSGFVSGASIHVLTSQIPKFFGIDIPRRSGLFSLIYVYVDIFKNLWTINWATFIISVICTIFLFVGKWLNTRFHKKLPIPIPWELGVVIFTTIASYYGKFKYNHDVAVVGHIPTGISTTVPLGSDIALVFVDSISLAIIAFTVEVSLCQMFATKHGYQVSSNQELLALGACNIFSAFFSCFPSAASLSRSVIYEEIGGKTQLGGFMSCAVVLSVLLWIGPLFEPLPQSALAVIIIVNIKSLVLLWRNVKPLWKVSRLDALTWLVAWFSVVLLGVVPGLLVGVSFSLLTVLFRTRSAKGFLIQPIANGATYRNPKRFDTQPLPDKIQIFHFTGPVYFANKDSFIQKLTDVLGFDPVKECMKKRASKVTEAVIFEPDPPPEYETTKIIETRFDNINPDSESDSMSLSGNETDVTLSPKREMELRNYKHHVIIDMNQCSFMDSDGAKVIRDLYDALTELDMKLILVACNDDVRHCLSQIWKDRDAIDYISLKSAVEYARFHISTYEA